MATWVHAVSHALIALAYALLVAALVYFVRRRRDVRVSATILCLGAFMLALGATRMLEIWRLWRADSVPLEIAELIGGALALPSAILMIRLLPRALEIPSLEALRASNDAIVALAAQFRELLESAPDAMVIADQAGRVFLVNAQTERLFGYGRSELIGRPGDVLIAERLRSDSATRRQAFHASPRPGRIELVGRHKDGREFPIEIMLSPIDTPNGVLVSCAIRDLSERLATETKLRTLSIAAQLVEAAPSAMLLIDEHDRIELVNGRTCTLYGYERDELIGQPLVSLVPERFRDRHVTLMSDVHEDPAPRMLGGGAQLFARRKDGGELPIEVQVSRLDSADGRRMLASVTDITERKRAEDELRQSNADLEHFAYIASHDLQEPLRMVASYTELLGQRYRGQLDAKADKYIHYAVDGAKRMQRMVGDLLAYSRVGSQGRALAPVALDAVVGRVRELLAHQIRDAGASFEIAPLPTVLADEAQINQLLQNLIGNALKFHGDAPPRIAIRATRAGERWDVAVSDNGIGIEMQHAQRIFDMFQRLHERGTYEGSGIGLAIAKRIVDRHGGKLWVDSTPGAGATFHFTLAPASEAAA